MRNEDLSSTEEKNKQNRNLLIIVLVLIALCSGLYWIMYRSTNKPTSASSKLESVSFAKSTDTIDAESVWMERAQNKLKYVEKNTSELKQTVDKMQNNESQKSVESDPRYQALQQQVQALQKAMDTSDQNRVNELSGQNKYKGQVFTTTPGVQVSNQQTDSSAVSVGIDTDVLNLKPIAGHDLPTKNPDSFVPAGTFVEAIMLGAADASAGVNSQSKPIPMLFRIVANGTLPNKKKSHLKGCVAVGAVTGDISSERGEIRIERLSCTFSNNEVVEQVVEGTIFGMDAKNGVRGNPVWREGALLGRAAVAGSLSGFANGISQSYVSNSVSPLGTTQTVDNGAIFKQGLASGASNAMEKLADYNIKRAEQYHPVIQISAGQSVDIVFLKGFYLDGKKHDDVAQEDHIQPELFSNASESISQTPTPGLTLTENQLNKIKQHENAFMSGDSQ